MLRNPPGADRAEFIGGMLCEDNRQHDDANGQRHAYSYRKHFGHSLASP